MWSIETAYNFRCTRSQFITSQQLFQHQPAPEHCRHFIHTEGRNVRYHHYFDAVHSSGSNYRYEDELKQHIALIPPADDVQRKSVKHIAVTVMKL